jgi:hypothetical protein
MWDGLHFTRRPSKECDGKKDLSGPLIRLQPDPIDWVEGSAGRKLAPHLSQDTHTVAWPELIIEGMIKLDPGSGAAGRGIIGIAILVKSIIGLIARSRVEE